MPFYIFLSMRRRICDTIYKLLEQVQTLAPVTDGRLFVLCDYPDLFLRRSHHDQESISGIRVIIPFFPTLVTRFSP